MATHSGILAWRIPMNRRAWRAIVHRVTKSRTRLKRLSMHARTVWMNLKDFMLREGSPTQNATLYIIMYPSIYINYSE